MIQKEQQEQPTVTNPVLFALEIGIFAGLIWGGFRWFFYKFQFTTIIPGYLAEPFFKHSFLLSPAGQWVGWLYFTLFSIIAALIYTLAFRHLKGPWPGITYGIIWWMIIYPLFGVSSGVLQKLSQLTWTTNLTEFCLFVLWGLFIGYSIAVEFTDERGREPSHAQADRANDQADQANDADKQHQQQGSKPRGAIH